jgi:hypothetical protein
VFRGSFERCLRYVQFEQLNVGRSVSYRTLPRRAIKGFEGKESVAAKSLIVTSVTSWASILHANQTDKVPILVVISRLGTTTSDIRSK